MRKFIKVKCAMSIVMLIIAHMEMMLINTYAHDFNSLYINNEMPAENENYSDFCEIKDEYEYVADKVEQELSESSSEINNDEAEQYLNSNGIFDDEIADFYSEKDIEEFENMGTEELEDVMISVSYFAVDDTEDAEKEELENSDMCQLTDEEVNMYLAEKYYNVDMGLDEKVLDRMDKDTDGNCDKESVADKIMESIGLKPVVAYAETQTKQRRSDGTLCMLKKVVTSHKVNADYAFVQTVLVWDTMPSNRRLDSIVIYYDNGQYEFDATGYLRDVEVVHFYSKIFKQGPVGDYTVTSRRVMSHMQETSSVSLKKNQYLLRSNSVSIALKLNTNEDKLLDNGDRYIREIEGEGVRCKMYVRLTGSNKKILRVYPSYLHTKTSLNLTETIISIVDGAHITAAYRLATGQDVKVSYDKSGVNEVFTFNYK